MVEADPLRLISTSFSEPLRLLICHLGASAIRIPILQVDRDVAGGAQ